jgi:hypothetical protein
MEEMLQLFSKSLKEPNKLLYVYEQRWANHGGASRGLSCPTS